MMFDPTRPRPGPRRRYTAMRRQGHRGGVILQHRALWRQRLPKRRLAIGALTAVAFTWLLALAQPVVAMLWGEQLVWWLRALQLPGYFATSELSALHLLSMPVPQIDLPLPAITGTQLAAHALAVVTVWTLAGWLPDAAKPGALVLRFAVLLHATSVVFFLFWPASFPHSLAGHLAGGLRQSWVLMVVTPWLHLCTYYLFPFPAWQSAALTALSLLFLVILAPLQYASHAAVLYLVGPIATPVLYLLFGMFVPVLGLVALFGWAMSWRAPAPEPLGV
jgi:hypothetical protein